MQGTFDRPSTDRRGPNGPPASRARGPVQRVRLQAQEGPCRDPPPRTLLEGRTQRYSRARRGAGGPPESGFRAKGLRIPVNGSCQEGPSGGPVWRGPSGRGPSGRTPKRARQSSPSIEPVKIRSRSGGRSVDRPGPSKTVLAPVESTRWTARIQDPQQGPSRGARLGARLEGPSRGPVSIETSSVYRPVYKTRSAGPLSIPLMRRCKVPLIDRLRTDEARMGRLHQGRAALYRGSVFRLKRARVETRLQGPFSRAVHKDIRGPVEAPVGRPNPAFVPRGFVYPSTARAKRARREGPSGEARLGEARLEGPPRGPVNRARQSSP
mmetsp:Transcript_9078/g.31961  ORF Transcript_9078/g.31961 Transcript_9078/m.31961 type:complete len:323 (-) Transcript_9078:61-1029(-)